MNQRIKKLTKHKMFYLPVSILHFIFKNILQIDLEKAVIYLFFIMHLCLCIVSFIYTLTSCMDHHSTGP